MSGSKESVVPRWALIAAGLVMAVTVTVAMMGNAQPSDAALNASPIVAERLVDFEDTEAGAVRATDRASQRVLQVFEPGTSGFVRGLLRGLVRERRARGVEGRGAFRIARRADGTVFIEDPAIGRVIDLAAFGKDNVAVFERLLEVPHAS